jgi:hypothetical protein
MLYTLILPAIFAFTALVGLALLANALSGLLASKAYGPELQDRNQPIFTVKYGEQSRKWGKVSLAIGLPLLLIAALGFSQLISFVNSAGYLRLLLVPPDGYTVLYGQEDESGLEIAYGFERQDLAELVVHFRGELEKAGFSVSSPTFVQLLGHQKDNVVTVNFIGSQPGDERDYRSKVIITYR